MLAKPTTTHHKEAALRLHITLMPDEAIWPHVAKEAERVYDLECYKFRITEGGVLMIFGLPHGDLHEAYGPGTWRDLWMD